MPTDLSNRPFVGEQAGSATAVQMPSVSAQMVKFKALRSNTGNVYIGRSSGVTVADGSTDTTTGLELGPGEDSGWIPVDNTNVFWYICNNATDDFTYMVIL